MAERRMFAKTIVLSDAFLDMSLGARCLYMTFGMVADDDGFVNNPKSIMRQCGASEDDLRILLAKKFLIAFDTGVIVIKHWRINNYLRNDRYQSTKYIDEKELLSVDEIGAYHLEESPGIPPGIPGIPSAVYPGKDRLGKDRLGKDRLGKDRLGKDSKEREEKVPAPPTLEEVKAYAKERNSPVDPQRFFDFFTAGGWKDSNGRPVKNWKQKLITWERRESTDGSSRDHGDGKDSRAEQERKWGKLDIL